MTRPDPLPGSAVSRLSAALAAALLALTSCASVARDASGPPPAAGRPAARQGEPRPPAPTPEPVPQEETADVRDPTLGELRVRTLEAPRGGNVRLVLFDTVVMFGRFSDPARVTTAPADGRDVFVMPDVPAGEYALVIHHDENADGEFDKNFLGIPIEPIAISRGYRPKGPPVWARAAFPLQPGETRSFELGLEPVLGLRGRLGVGLGAVGRSSPYVDGDSGVFQPIPAITYNGKRLQWLGPSLRYGLLGNDRVRLAATAQYRLRAYEEEDSPALEGLGDRKDTLLAGLAVLGELPAGINLAVGYEHDVLDQIGGGTATINARRAFQAGITRLTPTLGLNWVSEDLANHDFGVPSSAAQPGRPAYDVGDYVSLEAGLTTFVEITRDWRIVAAFDVEFLPSDVTDSPIVEEDYVVSGFVALTYAF